MGSTDSTKARRCRNIAFDILRLVAMLMVTMLHITGNGLDGVEIEAFSGVYWIVLIFNTFSLVAVNSFVLISGYFLSQKNISLKKMVALWFQVWTYSVAIYLLLCAMPDVDVNFSIPALVECLCPLLSNQYWFFTCYLLLYFVSPVLNRLIDAWDQQEHQKNTDCTDCDFLRNPIHQYLGRLLRNQSWLQFGLVFRFIFDCGVHSEISTAPAGSSGTGLRGSECGTLRSLQCYNSMESGHRFRTRNLD